MKRSDVFLALSKIRVEKDPSYIPDPLTIGGQEQLQYEKQEFELEVLKKNQENLQKSFTISNWFAGGIFSLVLLTLIMVFGIIIWQGILCPANRLDKHILITLLSTTSVNVIGLLYLVIKYVFHHRLKM